MSDSDEEPPTLSEQTLLALQDFYSQREEEKMIVNNSSMIVNNSSMIVNNSSMIVNNSSMIVNSSSMIVNNSSMIVNNSSSQDADTSRHFAVGALEEDWRLSQFWYTEDTATRLAEELLHEAGEGGRVACVSAPSVYQKLQQMCDPRRVSAVLLEYDRRFSIYGQDFIFYDYNEPLALASSVAPHSFDVVLADPPYLSETCLSRVSQTIKYLSKGKVLLCTGSIMENLAKQLLDVKVCNFLPRHNNNLSNEFRCFVNYPSCLLSC